LRVLPALRFQTAPTRYRQPDVTVALSEHSAWVAIEILSEDDRMSRMMEKFAEYATAGVRHIWLIDPRLRQLSVFSAGDLVRVDVLRTDDPAVELTADEIFQA
jgi:Uma2 family endonuclease